MNVLVVDDEEIICESIKADFNRMDCGITFDVRTAVSVAEAEIILENEKIDLLVTDINMPGGSGLLLVEKVRKKNLSCGILVAVSYNSFGKLFKDHTQMTFSNYVLHYRMELAKEYLSDSSIKIKQVASKVGYKENPQHFSRDFTRQVGVSPKEYRENRN